MHVQENNLKGQELRVYEFIVECEKYGLVPTLKQLAHHFEWESPNAAVYWINKLKGKGYLKHVEQSDFRSYKLAKKA